MATLNWFVQQFVPFCSVDGFGMDQKVPDSYQMAFIPETGITQNGRFLPKKV